MAPSTIFGPVLAGHAFQQTALIGMVPVLAQLLQLSEHQIGLAVAAGLLASALGMPVIGAVAGRRAVLFGLVGLLAANLALMALLISPAPVFGSAVMLSALVCVRLIQGLSVGSLLIAAQHASAQGPCTRRALGAVQSVAGIGRIGAALSIGPLLLLSPLAPLVPSLIGAVLSLFRVKHLPALKCTRTVRPPNVLVFRVTALTQVAVGASQVGIAPLIQAALDHPPAASAGYAGLCLAAANLGLFIAARFLLPHVSRQRARMAALCLLASGLMIVAAGHIAIIAACSFVIGASTALLFSLNLSEIMTRKDFAQLQVAGWNGAIQIASLAVGVGLGSMLMALDPTAPFAIAVFSGAALALSPPSIQRK
ncbi:hypothetical protein [Actibacterium sp. 188UL27-1]|uniref:hypothetical protein n=1 Tax=Actibacterium sp. 188UL27-1 TaxID=2786961 RepID=UPI00195E6B6C|nr:hypothetical protein [Actibacterium sp. 188UL27-1]MBM7069737.1 hypothetical protein [Actibacterium sp. 188UL27-1]